MHKPPTVFNQKGYCLIKFTIDGNRYSICRHKFDRQGKAVMGALSQRIYRDYLLGVFDPTLKAYKHEASQPSAKMKAKENKTDKELLSVKLREVFTMAYKEKWFSTHELNGRVKHLERFLYRYYGSEVTLAVFYLSDVTIKLSEHYNAKSSVSGMISCLRKLMSNLITHNMLPKNKPVPFTKTKRLVYAKKMVEVFTNEEWEKMSDARISFFLSDNIYWQYVRLLYFTGMRPGELLGLTASHLDLSKLSVTIDQSLSKRPGSTLRDVQKCTKTGSVRILPVNEYVFSLLVEWVNMGVCSSFVSGKGKSSLFDESYFFNQYWKKLMVRSGIKYRKPYALRHTFATKQLAAGIAPTTVAYWLGHTSLATLFSTYAHAIPSKDKVV